MAFLFHPGNCICNGLEQISWLKTQLSSGFCVVKPVIALQGIQGIAGVQRTVFFYVQIPPMRGAAIFAIHMGRTGRRLPPLCIFTIFRTSFIS